MLPVSPQVGGGPQSETSLHVGAVLCILRAQTYPQKISQLMAYMCTIIRIEKDFEDNAWQNYDTAFRRQAACTKSLEWGMIDPTLYSMVLTGHSKWKERCGYCFSADHAPHSWLSDTNAAAPMTMDAISTPTITGSA